ncbi:8282_t:CDS:1 [Gigaspora margarita]|uniref:8282_t:CDS:1 n=1 Tax=Gigaspora margarita TaxID=4874 RepID=A0ABN7V918_GIGMA|nr:8282_t:CDS:1 [Gigaspora margarita]
MANKNGFNIDFNVVAKEIKDLEKFNSNTFLPLDKLIAYRSRRDNIPPRAINAFFLFQKDLNAFLRSPETKLGDISILASKIWNNEDFSYNSYKLWGNIIINEIKPFYKKLSEIAKKIHKCSFPNYKYSPRRKNSKNNHLQNFEFNNPRRKNIKNKHFQNFKFNNLQYCQPYYYIYNSNPINFQSVNYNYYNNSNKPIRFDINLTRITEIDFHSFIKKSKISVDKHVKF